jgi:outer membrane protein OmpA-like peptidoglycan-associated protein
MTQIHANAGYTLLAVALAASLLYRPVVAADPVPAAAPGDAKPAAADALAGPVRQDFDALISEIEAKQPAQSTPTAASTADTAGDATSDDLNAARIQIGILRQAVVEALAARAEAEAQLETLWRDSRAEIEALKAAQTEGATRVSALESELARAKGAVAPNDGGEVETAAFGPADDALRTGTQTDGQASDVAPAAGPSELILAARPTEVMLNEIHFDPGSSTLTPGGKRKALEAAEKIKSLGARNVRVAGYTDTAGPAAYNMHLSLQRAKSIADLLQSVGVSSEIIEVEGNGEAGAPEATEDQVSEPLNRCAGIYALADLPASQAKQ